MITKIQYTGLTERDNIITQNTEKILIEEQNITEGNFLIFSDIKPLENQLQDQYNNQLILMDAIAQMYEDMMVKGTV